MTLALEQPKAEKELVWMFEVELRYRIEGATWTQADAPNTACWYMDHAAEGTPSKVGQLLRSTHVITDFGAVKANLAACQAAASSWYYDTATGRLYVHMSGGDAPDTASKYYLASHFWKRFVTAQYPAPDTIYDAAGLFIEPRLRVNIPDFTQEVNEFQEVGVRETWSSVNIVNGDAKFDAALAKYIWHMCLYYLKVGSPGGAYATFTTICRGRTGAIGFTDNEIEVRTEDQLRAEE